MMNVRLGIGLFALGLALGGVLESWTRPPATAVAAEGGSAMGAMKMPSKSTGDAEMNAAMARMSQSMATAKLTGAQDRDFMVMMIPHHQSAVDMAKIELQRGTRPELKALARDIIASQNTEIAQMHAWLRTWYPQSP